MTQITEDSRRLILQLVTCFGEGDLAGLTRLLHDDFVSHNPGVDQHAAPGKGHQAFLDHLHSPAAQQLFSGKLEVHRVLADTDHVAVHSQITTPEGQNIMIVDIFRIDEGQVIEHWDVIQPPPPTNHPA
jgi:predicted SnoaL-like aldol condensation-catalyzing enzyme